MDLTDNEISTYHIDDIVNKFESNYIDCIVENILNNILNNLCIDV